MATATKSIETTSQSGSDKGGTLAATPPGLSVDIALEVTINATPERVFEVLTRDTDLWFRPNDSPGMKLALEPRPGGRFYRDLGEGAGHWWGTVQVIKPPTLLEICGPLFLSMPCISHLSFRLEEDADRTKLRFHHWAIGPVPDGLLEAARENWTSILTKGLKDHAERNR